MSLLALEDVTKKVADGLGQEVVLDRVSMRVDAGEAVGIWGPRRSGKSTLLRIAAGSDSPDEGRVRFDGQDLGALTADEQVRLRRRNGLWLLRTSWPAERNKPVLEHVALPLLSEGLSLREARTPAWRALERVGAADCGHLHVEMLSAGERARVALAQALVHEPRVLLVDEPGATLRPMEAAAFIDLLYELRSDQGLALVVASEELAPIRKASQLMSLGNGRLRSMEQAATVVQLRSRRGQ